jgi:hypothetical protein
MVTGGSPLTALVFGEADRVYRVLRCPPVGADDSGLVVLREDAPREGPNDDTPWELVSVECLFDEWPGIGRGLDLAREHGAAELVGGQWRARGPGTD